MHYNRIVNSLIVWHSLIFSFLLLFQLTHIFFIYTLLLILYNKIQQPCFINFYFFHFFLYWKLWKNSNTLFNLSRQRLYYITDKKICTYFCMWQFSFLRKAPHYQRLQCQYNKFSDTFNGKFAASNRMAQRTSSITHCHWHLQQKYFKHKQG